MDIRRKQRVVVEALKDVKGRDIVVFNVARQSAHFERVVIASGDSNRQVNALATRVQETMKALGERIAGVEGRRNGEWVLVDLGDVVAHVMQAQTRLFYQLEKLWDVPPPEPAPVAKAPKAPRPRPDKARTRKGGKPRGKPKSRR